MRSPDPSLLAAIAAEIRALAGDDDAAFLDTLEGETDALEAADRLIAGVLDSEALAEAARAQARLLTERARRLDARGEACRAQLLVLLDAIGLTRIERPRATVSRQTGRPRVEIRDETAVPTQLCRIRREPDRAAIRRALEAGEIVPGAQLVLGPDTVVLRAG